MRNHRRIIASLFLAVVGFSAQDPALAGWDTWFKPDVVAAQVVPSSTNSTHVKVLIANTKSVSTGGFWIMVKAHKATPVYKYHYVSNIGPYDAISVDVDLGTYVLSPGLPTEARVDLFNQVKETNENNNVAYYIAPPW